VFSTLKKSARVCTLVVLAVLIKPMVIYTDDKDYAENILPGLKPWTFNNKSVSDPNLHQLKDKLFPTGTVYTSVSKKHEGWTQAFVVKHASSSHFDHLVELSQEDVKLLDRTLCLAESGCKFHGQRQRPWSALEGNIHLVIYLSPHRVIKNFHSGFPILAAVSLIDSLDAFEPLRRRAKIKGRGFPCPHTEC
jgi:hypothetical protein